MEGGRARGRAVREGRKAAGSGESMLLGGRADEERECLRKEAHGKAERGTGNLAEKGVAWRDGVGPSRSR